MSLATDAPAWLVAILFALLAIAAVEDAWRLRISNLVVLAIAASAVTAMVLTGLGLAAWQPLLVAIAVLVVGTPLFSKGWMGGGDVKLLSASALWFTFDGSWKMLAAVAVAGGVVALLALLLRLFRFSDAARARIAMLQRGKGIPYGIAVALGVAGAIIGARLGWV